MTGPYRTDPSPEQLAANIDPAVRDLVFAVERRRRRESGRDVEDLHTLMMQHYREIQGLVGELNARMNVLERAIQQTPSTRRRMELLVQVLKEQSENG